MSDHDAPDPMDKAYAQAEAVLSDETARAARRARVLAAVAGEAATPAVAASSPTRRPAWRRGGWLAAASVAGLGVFLASQVYLPTLNRPQVAPTVPAREAPAPAAAAVAVPPTPAAKAPSPPTKPAPRPSPVAVGVPTPLSEQRVQIAPAPPPLAPRPAPLDAAKARATAPKAAPAPPSSSEVSEVVVVTGERRAAALAAAPGLKSLAGSPPDQAARLRDAAAAGRTGEVAALLAKRVAVDAPDEEGDTALMKAIQADQPAAAALLRRHGASLDRKNRAGVSARDMAASIGDAELNRALGLGP
jgi:hypothetical protein